ncbi:Kv channel-interacting protein 2-like isoform X1 [Artemia franciscana]
MYAHFVFRAFDTNSSGTISFRDILMTLSVLLRGSDRDRLKWAFKLYDLNGDGQISKNEMVSIITSIYDLLGKTSASERIAQAHADSVFQKLDLNRDGRITLEEFLQGCLQDSTIADSLKLFMSS